MYVRSTLRRMELVSKMSWLVTVPVSDCSSAPPEEPRRIVSRALFQGEQSQ
jgi:hypothetical protein